MSKTFIIIFVILALGLVVFNVTQLDFNHPFQGDSLIACIGIMASLCAIVVVLIYAASKKIAEKMKDD